MNHCWVKWDLDLQILIYNIILECVGGVNQTFCDKYRLNYGNKLWLLSQNGSPIYLLLK